MVESGLTEKWMEYYMSKENKCDRLHSAIRRSGPKLEHTLGIFIVLVTGLATATLTFIIELLYSVCKK